MDHNDPAPAASSACSAANGEDQQLLGSSQGMPSVAMNPIGVAPGKPGLVPVATPVVKAIPVGFGGTGGGAGAVTVGYVDYCVLRE